MSIRNVVGAALFALSGAAALLGGGSPALGQAAETCPPGQPADRPTQYPPANCQLRLSRSAVAPGGSLEVAGSGFAPGAKVELAVGGTSLGSATAGGNGAFAATVVVPRSGAPGTYTVTATGPAAVGGTRVLSASLTVTGDASTDGTTGVAGGTRGQSLPRTGSSSPVPLALAGGALMAAGLGVVVVARRRAGSV